MGHRFHTEGWKPQKHNQCLTTEVTHRLLSLKQYILHKANKDRKYKPSLKAQIILLRHIFSAPFLQTNQAPPTPNSTSPLPQCEKVDLEEQQLRQKLHEMTDNISDHSLTSDEDESSRPHSSQEVPAWRSPERDAKPTRLPTRSTSRTSIIVSRLEEEEPQQTDSQKVEMSVAELNEQSISGGEKNQKVHQKHANCTSGLLHILYFTKQWNPIPPLLESSSSTFCSHK